MITHVKADINCSTCFNHVIETMSSTQGVASVDPHVVAGCLAIDHELDEADLLAIITTIGHTLDIAPNGEIAMGQAQAHAIAACDLR